MKLLVIVSSLDLTQPFSATPAWWQLLKALYEVGVDVIATPYQGQPSSPPGGAPLPTLPGARVTSSSWPATLCAA